MYTVIATGVGRNASFEIDEAGEILKQNELTVYEDSVCDCIDVKIFENKPQPGKAQSSLVEYWMVLKGTSEAIVKAIPSEAPISMLAADAIFDYLETISGEEEAIITYSMSNGSRVIQSSKIKKALVVAQTKIIAKLYKRESDEVKLINIW